MTFHELSQTFSEIGKESSRLKITELLADLYNKVSINEAQIITYLSLGRLRPPYKGTQFNFAQENIKKTISEILKENYSDFEKQLKEVGDMGSALLEVDWPFQDSGLTVEQVYEQLSNLEEISGKGSQEEKSKVLKNLLKNFDALSASFVIKIILGTLRLGFSDMTVVDSLSWSIAGNKSLRKEIENSYNLCADLGIIAKHLKECGLDGIKHIKPILGIPIRLAAAERMANAKEIFDKIGPCVAQPKLDGFRLQIHIDKSQEEPKIYFFSRNLQNMSYMFPDLVEALKDVPVNNVIVEGEAIVYDESSDSFLPFQETVKRKRKHGIEEASKSLPLYLFLFDILYINDQNVLQKSHYERRKILVDVFENYKPQVINIIEEKFFESATELNDYFNEQIEKGLEGLVIKKPNAPYQPGKRNFNWIKLKRMSEGHLKDTIDTIILGYYFGKGRRASFGIGAFLVGVYNQEKDKFETVAKIGTGLKDHEWIELKEKCDKISVKSQPHNVICAPELKPDVWVDPQIVTIILADEVTRSPLHSAGKTKERLGLALRFPRFMGYAGDKLAEQSTSVKELKELFDLQFINSKK